MPSGRRAGRGYTGSDTGGASKGVLRFMRVFGGYFMAGKFVDMAKEMAMNASFYNGLIEARQDAQPRPVMIRATAHLLAGG
ncbi:MAG: hypothetical protein JRN51_08225 [Nitrososphaerota archaeon]|nr:hypothetical protein [Nitrososphaerota archaeon]